MIAFWLRSEAMRVVDRIGRRVKLRDLHILLAVAEHGSMAKAAHDLAVSQPVVSKTISELEHAIGVRLLDRNRQGIVPTPYGRALLRRSLAAFDELREGMKEIEFLAEPAAGDVRIGAAAAMTAGLLPAAINRIRGEYPRLTMHVRHLFTSPVVYENLRERTVDFMIGRILSRTHERDLNVETLFDEPLFVVAGQQSRWAKRRKIAIVDLLNEPWILPDPDTEVGTLVAQVFHASGVEVPRAAVVSSSIEMYWFLLGTADYLALLPKSLLRFSAQRHLVKVLPVVVPAQPRPVGIVTLKSRTLSPAVQLVIDHIRELAKPLAKADHPKENAT
jgi:DNA-binding transcriptional LysR family regulator